MHLKFDKLGNIIGLDIPTYNRITEADDDVVVEAKKIVQLEQLKAMAAGLNEE